MGSSIQHAVARGGPNAVFCLGSGEHRMQAVAPLQGQRFYGEGKAALNGSQVLTRFRQEGNLWVADAQLPPGAPHGACRPGSEACGVGGGLFLNDRPLAKAPDKAGVKPGWYYTDRVHSRLYLADDPTGQKVEFAVASHAFRSNAGGVVIANLIVEKYANPAQSGAIHGQDGTGWVIDNVEARLNTGVGVRVGDRGHIKRSNLHHNGQLGASALGRDILIEDNEIWANNIYGFDFKWEAGGVKVVLSERVAFRRNRVHDNVGPGLWCDIDCRDATYEFNTLEDNADAGIFHEISFDGVIRDNTVRRNGVGSRAWFWGADILVAGSQNTKVYRNTITVSAGGCAIVLIDQNRRNEQGGTYKTRGNQIFDNRLDFEAEPCAGGVSDAKPYEENFGIIAGGGNSFDGNTYTARAAPAAKRFVWDREETDWAGFRARGLERHGTLSIR